MADNRTYKPGVISTDEIMTADSERFTGWFPRAPEDAKNLAIRWAQNLMENYGMTEDSALPQATKMADRFWDYTQDNRDTLGDDSSEDVLVVVPSDCEFLKRRKVDLNYYLYWYFMVELHEFGWKHSKKQGTL